MPAAAQTNTPAPTQAPTSASSPAARTDDHREVMIYLKDGQQVTGLLIATDPKQLTVRVAGIDTRIPTENVDRYDVLPPILDRYEELRRSIGNDPDDIVRLARWLQTREQYSLALTEVLRAIDIDKTHSDALRLKTILEQQIILNARRAAGGGKKDPGSPAPKAANPERAKAGEFPLLTPEEINLIKVYEVDLQASPPARVLIPRETILKMLDANSGHPLVPLTREGREAILRKPPIEVLDLMFKLQAREFYPQVEVLDPPTSVRLFRENVERTWLMSCATSQCHGGLEAGRLVLSNRAPNSDAAVYTNMYILQKFRTSLGPTSNRGKPGKPAPTPPAAAPAAPAVVPLINWDNPERSPLLQAGLPREDSLFPHPIVPRPTQKDGSGGGGDMWKPEFHTTDDKPFQKTLDWMRSMYRPRPEYPIQYNPLRPFDPIPKPNPAASAPAPEPVKR